MLDELPDRIIIDCPTPLTHAQYLIYAAIMKLASLSHSVYGMPRPPIGTASPPLVLEDSIVDEWSSMCERSHLQALRLLKAVCVHPSLTHTSFHQSESGKLTALSDLLLQAGYAKASDLDSGIKAFTYIPRYPFTLYSSPYIDDSKDQRAIPSHASTAHLRNKTIIFAQSRYAVGTTASKS